MYQVGRNSVSHSKKASGSKLGVHTTVDPAANAVSSPEIRPCAWNNGSTLSNRSTASSCNTAPALWADWQTLACVKGTIFGRDVVPDVIRMKASLSAPAANSPLTGGRVPELRRSTRKALRQAVTRDR